MNVFEFRNLLSSEEKKEDVNDEKIYYYSNGNIKEKGKWKDGKQHGEWVYYDENGNITQTGNWKDEFVKFGLGYRYTNWDGIKTPKVLLGYEKENLKVAFACDINIGPYVDAPYAIELAANYIISSPPKVELPSKVFCPQL